MKLNIIIQNRWRGSVPLVLIIIRLVALVILAWVAFLPHLLHLPLAKHLTYRVGACLFALGRVVFILLRVLVHVRPVALHVIILVNGLWLCLLIMLLRLIAHGLHPGLALSYHILVLLLQLTGLLGPLILV